MSAVNRCGLGIMLIAIMVMIGAGLEVEPAPGILCSITALLGLIAFVYERE